ncbi:MAG: hypothetical protein ACI9HI_000256 [Salinirussus sp.]|jgi:hypothetical protein
MVQFSEATTSGTRGVLGRRVARRHTRCRRGDRGGRLREGVAGLDRVVDRGDIGYVSLVGAAV